MWDPEGDAKEPENRTKVPLSRPFTLLYLSIDREDRVMGLSYQKRGQDTVR